MGAQAFASDVVEPVLDHMTEHNVQWVRFIVPWSSVEPVQSSPPTYSWEWLDGMVSALAGNGFTVVGIVLGNPSWAATTDCGPVNKVPLARYRQFLRDLAERYDGDLVQDAPRSPRVVHWEIYNEEDFNPDRAGGEDDYGGCFGNNPNAYAEQLRQAYLGIHEANPTAHVLFGGVAHDRFYNKSGYSPVGPFHYTFVRDVLTYLKNNYGSEAQWPFFDMMGLHLYNDYRNNWDGTPPLEQELLGKVARFRTNQLYRVGFYDLRSVPLAITELSLPSMPSDAYTLRDETTQAAYPGQVLIRSRAVGAPIAMWFTVEDYLTGACDSPWSWLTFGLLKSQSVYEAAQRCTPNPLPDYQVDEPHQPKPAIVALRTAVEQLAGWAYELQLTASQTGSVRIEAHRFVSPGNHYRIALFTDHGERLGRRGYPPLEVTMTFNASLLPDWTGTLRVVDYLGNVTRYYGPSVVLTIKQWPQYVSAE